VSSAAVVAPAGTLSGSTLASGVTASSLTSLGTIANLTATAGTIATTPSAATDIANKLYVDTVAQGLDAKASCLAATTANITLSGTQTIDGVSVVAGNRVLVKDQTAPERQRHLPLRGRRMDAKHRRRHVRLAGLGLYLHRARLGQRRRGLRLHR
jgi:hypothetical protein